MRPGSQFVLRAVARLQAPLLALFALSLFVTRPAGEGVGFLAGIVFALLFSLHVLVFGAAAARKAFPTFAARGAVAFGLIGVTAGAGLPRFVYAAQTTEAGLFLLTAGTAALVITVLVGRAPTMRDEDWG